MLDDNSRLDGIITKLKLIDNFTYDDHVELNRGDFKWLTKKSIEVFKREPIMLNIGAPLCVLGDLHGQYFDLLRFLQIGGDLPETKYLFLGDYVDRGWNSVETITLLLALKCRYPESVYMIRGNHESSFVSRRYGFYEECAKYFEPSIWQMFIDVFNWMPIAAIISDKIFCVHGGLSPHLKSLRQISKIHRPLELQDEGLAAELLWADPGPDHRGWRNSSRSAAYTFGYDVVQRFLRDNNFDLILRAHQMADRGYSFPFRPRRGVLTLFSAPSYCGRFDNKGAILFISETLVCRFARFGY